LKTPSAVRQKLKQLRFRYIKKWLDTTLKVAPHNCAHNVVFEPPNGAPEIRCCTLIRESGSLVKPPAIYGVVCDPRHGGLERAAACPHYKPLYEKDTVKREFYDELNSMTLPQIAAEYPDMAALLWVLGEDSDPADAAEFDDPAPPAPPAPMEDVPVHLPVPTPLSVEPPASVARAAMAPYLTWFAAVSSWLSRVF
jgi:hypothetical protein